MEYKYILEPYASHKKTRHTCPSPCCNRPHVFVRYVNKETGDYLADNVGRCNREIKCGYHYTPKQFFQDNPNAVNHNKTSTLPAPKSKKHETAQVVTVIPREIYQPCLKSFSDNSLFQYLNRKFESHDKAVNVFQRYLIGSSKHWRGATAFPQIDVNGLIRQVKIIDYNPETGKRKKSQDESWKWRLKERDWHKDVNGQDKIFFAGKQIMGYPKTANFQQCFFGEHLLRSECKTVALVESEKTALIAAVYLPDFIWLATGGVNGCKWTDEKVYKVLCSRDVVLVPDLKALEKWTDMAKVLATVTKSLKFFDLQQWEPTYKEIADGLDIADYLVRVRLSEFHINKK